MRRTFIFHSQFSITAHKNAQYVLPGHIHHQHKQQHESCRVHIALVLGRHGLAANALDDEEHEPTAVQCGQRQQVHHGKVDRDERAEVENALRRRGKAVLIVLLGLLLRLLAGAREAAYPWRLGGTLGVVGMLLFVGTTLTVTIRRARAASREIGPGDEAGARPAAPASSGGREAR